MKRWPRTVAATTASLALLAGCAFERPVERAQPELSPVAFSDLEGWQDDHQLHAIEPMRRSCAVFEKKPAQTSLGLAGTVGNWLPWCRALRDADLQSDAQARDFIQAWFAPYAVNRQKPGLFTGYYEAELNGSWQATPSFQTPLWQRPLDLVTADLGAFRKEWKGKKIVGKVVGHAFEPYDDRALIAQGSLAQQGRAVPLLWVNDPIDAFFLEIQGSGSIRMPDGAVVRVGYDAQNGQAYVPIGRVLRDQGALQPPVTMEKIRQWLQEHPHQAQATMNQNPSTVFFRQIQGPGPLGAQGVALTPGRSLAVDRASWPLGVPLWLELAPDEQGVTISPRLVIAQDTGGAIQGQVRGDLFWGAGSQAQEQAGKMQSQGTYFLLLPKALKVSDANGR